MEASYSYFDEVADAGERVLGAFDGTGLTAAQTRRYVRRVGRIYALLAQVHGQVVKVAVEACEARTLEEARDALGRLDTSGLKSALSARHLCDRLERAGKALAPHVANLPVSDGDKRLWDEVSTSMQEREAETALLYMNHLADLTNLSWNEPSFDELRRKVDVISRELAVQKAEFELLAMRAAAMARRLH